MGDASWKGGGATTLNEFLVSTAGEAETVKLSGKLQYWDVLDGGADTDTVQGGDGKDVLLLESATAPIAGGDATLARLVGIELFDLGSGGDVLDLTSATLAYTTNVIAKGGDGNDTLWTGAGNDVIEGGLGKDYVAGGAGDDTLSANGVDGVGDKAKDIFGFGDIADAGIDTILDFEDGKDQLRLVGFGITSITDPKLAIVQDGLDTRITVTDDHTQVIVLQNILATQLTSSDFSFTA